MRKTKRKNGEIFSDREEKGGRSGYPGVQSDYQIRANGFWGDSVTLLFRI